MSGLYYSRLDSYPIIGTVAKELGEYLTPTTAVRTEWALTSAYRAENVTLPTITTKTFRTAGFSKLNLDVSYTMGVGETGNSIQLKVEGSPDGVNFYRIPNETISSGTSTLVAREFTFVGANAANATISLGLDIFYKWMRVSAKETIGSTTYGTTYIEATLAGL